MRRSCDCPKVFIQNAEKISVKTNNKIIELKTGYSPKIESPETIKFPIQLKNKDGSVIASIEFWEGSEYLRKGYYAFINGHNVNDSGFETITECMEAAFAYLYVKMHEYRKISEKYNELKRILKDVTE
jgi:hypothetical protein